MTPFALLLVLAAAGLHATWNYCAKRAGGGLPFVWLVGSIICSCYVPVLLIYGTWWSLSLSTFAVAWILGSGVLKTSYSLFLQRGYRTGDFSLIYPLARGTGPLLATLAAIAFLGERPSALALAGAAVIVLSIFWLTGGFGKFASLLRRRPAPLLPAPADAGPLAARPRVFSAVNYGLMSGVFIAAYTLWDRHGVAALAIAPVLYDAGTAFTQLALLTPFALRRWPEVATHWRAHRRYAFGVALLSPVAYILILTAMKFTPVSYVAPAREISIVIGAFMGARLLKESDSRRRLVAAVAMAAGVIALALG
ncbi:EamA family transporter [Horticoccus luteus]|uniref:EamA family transporter n=1 Tax=Horticoccus luteus TaxID=2862869 RepID=A0A8F9XGW2_9BACT|nr:EamA family transporter [Horticoccus luteus]QYM78670.1 EamA family transporter [Horticoccus luteus]